MVQNMAVLLHDPERVESTMLALRKVAEPLGLKVVSGHEASGLIGQFAALAKLILYFMVSAIFGVTLIVINNTMIMKTLLIILIAFIGSA